MITGTVNANPEPVIRITVYGADGQVQERPAIVDTGFNGWLTLPPDFIAALGMRWKRLGTAVLDDGSEVEFDVYAATIFWDGQPVTIPVDEADAEPLVGTSLMYGCDLNVPVVDGGAVTLKRFDSP